MPAAARALGPAPEDPRYAASEALLRRARAVIPLGARLPLGVSPHFAVRAKGAAFWDEDGHAYVDFCNAHGAVILGHADPDVVAAAQAQVAEGQVFSMPHRLEAEVAERLCALVACAEAVRFGRSRSDAVAAALRLARAHTGRELVAACGAQARPERSIAFAYDDLPALAALLDRHAGRVAAVLIEPLGAQAPSLGYLAGVRRLVDAHGAVLVFDESLTGFRLDEGGAQGLYGVTPDLAVFGAGLANGFPLSALAGRKGLMQGVHEAFAPLGPGADAVSMAAARALLAKLEREPVITTLRIRGAEVQAEVEALLAAPGPEPLGAISGDPTWSVLTLAAPEGTSATTLETLFLQEVFARGVFTLGAHVMSYAHGDDEITALLGVYREVLPLLAEAVRRGDAEARLRCEPVQPQFVAR
jgi:glutamate-1-semialdehyde aminotransferase